MAGQDEEGRVAWDDASRMPGVPDAFQRLWTPHRMVYINGQGRPSDTVAGEGCPFCAAPRRPDEDGLIVARGTTAFVVLNLYPYNPGHLLVCPYRHVADYPELTAEETAEVASLTQTAMRVLARVSHPHGFNLGMNQGAVAGAGIAGHLHQHVVPRWGGDANFLPIVARTKALPQVHDDVWRALTEAWPRDDARDGDRSGGGGPE